MFTTTSRVEENEHQIHIGDCIVSKMTTDVAPECESYYREQAQESDGEDEEEENKDHETNPWDKSIFASMNLEPVSKHYS
jgi:hypothetical protein